MHRPGQVLAFLWLLLTLVLPSDLLALRALEPETRVYAIRTPSGEPLPGSEAPESRTATGEDGCRYDDSHRAAYIQALVQEALGDASTDQLLSAQFRHARPGMGRWTSRDPGGFIDGPNRYKWVGNSPSRFRDLNGLLGTEVQPIIQAVPEIVMGIGIGAEVVASSAGPAAGTVATATAVTKTVAGGSALAAAAPWVGGAVLVAGVVYGGYKLCELLRRPAVPQPRVGLPVDPPVVPEPRTGPDVTPTTDDDDDDDGKCVGPYALSISEFSPEIGRVIALLSKPVPASDSKGGKVLSKGLLAQLGEVGKADGWVKRKATATVCLHTTGGKVSKAEIHWIENPSLNLGLGDFGAKLISLLDDD